MKVLHLLFEVRDAKIILMKKILLVTFITITLIALFYILIKPSSKEIAYLRDIEKQLSIPKADHRKEYDRGCFHDLKGARQYERQIYYYFSDNTSLSDLINRLKNDQAWIQKQSSDSDWLKFKKVTDDACISISTYNSPSIFLSNCLDREVCRYSK